MSDTNLITQAVIAGLQAQIDIIQNNLTVANANLQSVSNNLTANLATSYSSLASQLSAATASLTSLLNGYNSTLTASLNAHIAANYSTAHGGISATSGDYRDSSNDQVGTKIVDIIIAGVHYYVPASPSPVGVCYTPPCYSPPFSQGSCHRESGNGC